MDRQKEVLVCFNGDRDIQLTKQEIIEKAGLHYYHNTDKHAGDVLSRMVKSGLLVRVKKGVFRLGSPVKKAPIVIDKNQTSILKELI